LRFKFVVDISLLHLEEKLLVLSVEVARKSLSLHDLIAMKAPAQPVTFFFRTRSQRATLLRLMLL
jgi:hypothetical protein